MSIITLNMFQIYHFGYDYSCLASNIEYNHTNLVLLLMILCCYICY